jgi:hypothetical protein
MSNPNKQWSWGGALGRSTGTALSGASVGAINGALGGPLGVPLGATVFAAIGFTTGLIGAGLGHWWDDMLRDAEGFGSGVLYSLVVSSSLTIFATLLVQPSLLSSPNATLALALIISPLCIVATASKSLIDDLHYTYFGKRHTTISAAKSKYKRMLVNEKDLGDDLSKKFKPTKKH